MSYDLPLIEGGTYEIFQQLPQPRVFHLQVYQKKLLATNDSKKQTLGIKEDIAVCTDKACSNSNTNDKML